MPVLVPADSAEVVKLGIHAAWMSRESGLWTALRVTAAVADGSSTVTLDGPPVAPAPPADGHSPSARTLGATLHELEASRVGVRLERARAYARDRGLNRVLHEENPTVSASSVLAPRRWPSRRLRDLGPPTASACSPGHDGPLDSSRSPTSPPARLHHRRRGQGHVPAGIRRPRSGRAPSSPELRARRRRRAAPGSRPPRDFARGPGPRRSVKHCPVRARPHPHFCSGCPHNASTRVTGDSLVGAGIGCHDGAAHGRNPSRRRHRHHADGRRGAHWIGMSPCPRTPPGAEPRRRHLLPFRFSGGARWYPGVDVTLKLLHNGTVAMTGGQDPVGQMPPGSSTAARRGRRPHRRDHRRRPHPQGAWGSLRTRPAPRPWRSATDLADVQRARRRIRVTVLVHDQSCATEMRRARKRKALTRRSGSSSTSASARLRRLRRKVRLSVRPARRHRVRAQDAHRPDHLQSRLLLHPGRLPGVHGGHGRPGGGPRAGSADAGPAFFALRRRPRSPARPPRAGRSWNVRVTASAARAWSALAAVIAPRREDGRHPRRRHDGSGAERAAVVSDVRITDGAVEQSGLVPAGAADLLLACDGPTSADPANLAVIGRPTTAGLVDVDAHRRDVPTSAPSVPTAWRWPGRSPLRRPCRHRRCGGRGPRSLWRRHRAFTLLLGAAVQVGALPISPAVENALRSNGIAVGANIQAFRRGRQPPHRRPWPRRCGTRPGPPGTRRPVPPPTRRRARLVLRLSTTSWVPRSGGCPWSCRPICAIRSPCVAELRAGRRTDARGYLDDLAVLAGAERASPRGTTPPRAAVFGLHKLTAYKDEYRSPASP